MSSGKGRKNSGNLQKKLVENAEFFIIWRFPFPDEASGSLHRCILVLENKIMCCQYTQDK